MTGIPIPKKGNPKECSNYCTIALISHASRVMLKILRTRLQQHINWELPDVQAGFRKGSGTRDQIANIYCIIEKAREFQKNICFCFTDYAKAFDCVDHNKLWKILKETRIPDHLTCLLRNLYAGQEALVRTAHGVTVQFSSVIQSCLTLCDPVNRSTPGLPVQPSSQSPLKSISTESVMPSNHLILCHPLLPAPSIFPSIRVFSNESALWIKLPKYWNFSYNISPSNEIPGLISFRIDWFNLLAVQGTLENLLQHHSSKVSILQYSAFFIVQLSHPYMTTGKTIPLTRWTFVGQVMSVLFSMLSRLVITFLPRSKHLLISWLQSPSGVILNPRKIGLFQIGKGVHQSSILSP